MIIKQTLVGAGFGAIGFILFIVFGQLIFGRLDLFGSILYALASGYVTMYFGIVIYNYIQLRQLLSATQVFRVYYVTFPALILTLYLFIFSNWGWGWYVGCLTLLYSIIGLFWGFNRTISNRNINQL